MNRQLLTCLCALIALTLTISAQAPAARGTGDQRRQYVFAPTGQQMPYRVYVPKTWDGKASLPIILMLHGAGANESTYLDQADGLLMKLAEQHGYIVVSPLGFTPLGAYGNPLRLPAVFGQTAAAASQRAAVTPARQRELNLSELEAMTALETVTEEYGADRSRTYLAGHSMGSGGAWHLAARYPERWRAVAPMSGPFVDEATYPFDRIKRLPIFMTEGTGATPSLDGSRVLARHMREGGFAFEYLEVDGNHGSMVPMVWPRIFEFFNRQDGRVAAQQTTPGAAACTALGAAMFAAVARLTTTYDAGSAPQPAHCVVRGSAAPRTGVDGKAYETRFELRLPTDWSGRFLYQGGGGNDGAVAPAVGRNTGSFPDTGLQRGFAVVTTDAGHQGATAEFGLDPQARIDHAYAAHERTATIALAIVARYYGRAPNRKYFVGCSGGGRQGMMFAQRYPSYFDGIAICAPAMSVSSGATIAAAWDTQTYLSIAPANEQGQRVLSRAFSDADMALVARGITGTCDAADGATDGMVLRPESCRFDPNGLKCAGAKQPDCLTSDQIAALQKTFGGPRDSSGKSLYVGQPWDPGIATAGWRQWKLGTSQTSTPNAINSTLMAGALAHEFVTPPDPSFAITRFDFDRDPKRMEAFSAVYDTYRDATLAEFRKRGGKLLIFHGTADPIFSALESLDYYQRLTRNNGGPEATAEWARLFLVPGMNHCAGGPATDSFDGLGAIVDWVEKGTAPVRIEASALPGTKYFAGRTRPLCPYPSFARYVGAGSLEDSANFVCAAPQGPAPSESPVRGLYNWIHSTGDAERSFSFYRDVFGIELARSPFAGTASANALPEPIRPASQAGSDALVWDLTNTHGSRFRTVFMRAANTPFGLELSEFFDVPRSERQANAWDPGASKLIFTVRDLDAVIGRLKTRRAPVVTIGGVALTTPSGRAMLVRDPDGYLVEVRQASSAAVTAAKASGAVIETAIWISVARRERALAFYETLLGFQIRATRIATGAELRVNGLTDGRLTQTVMSIPGIEATVVLAEFARPTTSNPAATPFEWRVQDVGAPQFQLEVAGLDALLERTARAGYRFLSVGAKPIQRPFGRFVFAIDPDGILVEFVEPAVRAR